MRERYSTTRNSDGGDGSGNTIGAILGAILVIGVIGARVWLRMERNSERSRSESSPTQTYRPPTYTPPSNPSSYSTRPSPSPRPASASSSTWKMVTSTDGGYSVTAPRNVIEEEFFYNDDRRLPGKALKWLHDDDQPSYIAQYADVLPADEPADDHAAWLDETAKLLTEGHIGILTITRIEKMGFSGIEIVQDRGEDVFTKSRIYRVGRRMIMVTVGYGKSQRHDQNIDRFLSSLRFDMHSPALTKIIRESSTPSGRQASKGPTPPRPRSVTPSPIPPLAIRPPDRSNPARPAPDPAPSIPPSKRIEPSPGPESTGPESGTESTTPGTITPDTAAPSAPLPDVTRPVTPSPKPPAKQPEKPATPRRTFSGDLSDAEMVELVAAIEGEDRLLKSSGLLWLRMNKPKKKNDDVAKALVAVINTDTTSSMLARLAMKEWATPAVEPQIIAWCDESDRFARHEAFKILAQLRSAKGAEAVAKRLLEAQDRSWASRALADMGAIAEPAVVKYLLHSDDAVKREACEILSDVGTARSLPVLNRLSKDRNKSLAFAAERAVAQIKTRK